MKKKCYIILFKDGTLQFFAHKHSVEKDNFQQGIRVFEVNDNLPVIEVCEWIGKYYEHSQFVEKKFAFNGKLQK